MVSARNPGVRYGPLFAVALAIRLAHLFFMRESPFFAHPVVDSKTYLDMAVGIAESRGWGQTVFWQPPLYPLFLAGIFAFGKGILLPRLVQVVLGGLNCVLIRRLGEITWPESKTGTLAGWMAAFYGPFIFFDAELLAPALIVFLDLLVLLWIQGRGEGARPVAWIVPGLLLGLSAVARAQILLVAVLLALWLLCTPARRGQRLRAAFAACSLVVGISAAVLPVSLHNRVAGSDWVLVSYNGGINLYIGNNPDYDATVAMRPGYRWEELTRRADDAGAVKPSERSAFFRDAAIDYALAEPWGWLALMGKKLVLFLNGFEIPRNVDIYFQRRYSPILSVLLWDAGLKFPLGLVFPLALVGLVRPGRRARELAPLYIFVLGYSVSVLIFFVTARYRVPVAAVLLLFAVRGGAYIMTTLRTRKRAILIGTSLCALLLLCNLPPPTGARSLEGEAYYFVGVADLAEERPARALKAFEEATRLDTKNAEAWNNLGNLLYESGSVERAIDAYRSALGADPDHESTLVNMAGVLLARGSLQESERFASKALRVNPKNWRAHLYLAVIYEASGDEERSRHHKSRAETYGAPRR